MTAALLFSAAATTLLLVLLRRAAPTLSLVDHPAAHRRHGVPTPLVGGVAIFLGCVFGLLASDIPLSHLRGLFLGCGLLVVVGVLDDIHELSSTARFVAQILAALAMIHQGGVVLITVGDLSGAGQMYLGSWQLPLTVFATVGVINSLNMIDGLDGLSGCLLLIALAGLIYFGQAAGLDADLSVLVVLATAVGCFLLFNLRFGPWRRARVFLGDAGSMFLGFALCWFLVDFSQKPDAAMRPVTALWLVAIPLCDTVAVMVRRLAERRSPFAADRTHIHHLLQHAGCSVDRALGLIVLYALSCAAFGIFGERLGWSEATSFYAFLAMFAVHLAANVWYVRRHRETLRTTD